MRVMLRSQTLRIRCVWNAYKLMPIHLRRRKILVLFNVTYLRRFSLYERQKLIFEIVALYEEKLLECPYYCKNFQIWKRKFLKYLKTTQDNTKTSAKTCCECDVYMCILVFANIYSSLERKQIARGTSDWTSCLLYISFILQRIINIHIPEKR